MASLALPPEYSAQRRNAVERRIDQAVELLHDRNHTLILMHNDPDPDAMASGLAMEALFSHRLPQHKWSLAYGGIIGRAENRTFSSLFIPHAQRIPGNDAEEEVQKYDAVIMVDTQPAAGNHLLFASVYPTENIVWAIDHHPPRRSQVRAGVHDVRPEIGSCSTMLCEYLAVLGVEFDTALATALFYGIKSDTRGLSRHTDELDIWAYSVLRNLIDTDLLNQIEQVQLPRSYFRGISDALTNTTLYHCKPSRSTGVTDDAGQGNDLEAPVHDRGSVEGKGEQSEGEQSEGEQPCHGDVAVSLLFDMKRPDMAAEVADLMLRVEDVSWSICLGIYEERVVISVRTDAAMAQAGRLIRSIVGKNGTAGGHDTMAGGRIYLPDRTPSERIAELHALVPQFLNALGVGESAGIPLLDVSP